MIFITQHIGIKAQKKFHNANIHAIDSSAFFFDRESTARLFKMEGIRLSDDELDSVYTSTEGWIAALRLQISNYRQTGSFSYTADIDHLVENAIWKNLKPDEKTLLVSLSVMESFTARQAAIMHGEEVLPEHIRDLLKHNDFIRYFPREKIFVMHSILQKYLRNQFYQYQPESFQKRVLRTAGKCCIAESDYYSAAQFFLKVRDFDSIFSIPFTGIYLANKRENNMIEFLLEIISESPEETMCRYPFVLIMYSYLLRMDGEYECYHKLCRLIESAIESNRAGLSEDELRQLKGEYLLLTSFTPYNDIKKVNEEQKAALELLGGASRFGLKDIPITLGATSVLSMFWREPGKLDEALDDLKKSLPYHLKLTRAQGTGADSALHAEIMLLRGDDVQAEILCHRALYQARSRKEISICLCAEQILARIAIMRGDAESFFTALENIKGYADVSSNLYVLRMIDICLSAIGIALGTTDMVASWLYDIESINKKVYARAVPYVNILYSHLLVSNKRYTEFLGLADNTLNMAKEMNYILPQVYNWVFRAVAYYNIGREHEALECMEKALLLALPDRVYLPFAHIAYLDDILSRTRIHTAKKRSNSIAFSDPYRAEDSVPFSDAFKAMPGWKDEIGNMISLYNRYQKGRVEIVNTIRQAQSPLTPREREVAVLARARFSYEEIAGQLCISKATVRTILHNVYSKLGIHSKSELSKIDF